MTSTPGASGKNSETNFGDFVITPRIILSESKNVTQTFNLNFRTPTGDVFNGNHVASIGPQYNFWANSWKGLVVRGGAGFSVPYAGDITRSGARSTFDANLAVGYYFTPHDYTPVGDMVSQYVQQYLCVADARFSHPHGPELVPAWCCRGSRD
jgi:hypothetical protein